MCRCAPRSSPSPIWRRALELVARAIRLPLHQVIALPLTFEERLLGVIYLFRSGSIAFTANDRAVLGSFADQAAIAVRNAQLYQQVSAEKQQLDAIIQHSADGVMILDPDLRIQVFNRALSQMTGWPAEAAIGRPCYEVLALEEATGANLCGSDARDGRLSRKASRSWSRACWRGRAARASPSASPIRRSTTRKAGWRKSSPTWWTSHASARRRR